ncbi:MAG: hypothetical protein AB7U45_03715 [Desulfamplus sp.]
MSEENMNNGFPSAEGGQQSQGSEYSGGVYDPGYYNNQGQGGYPQSSQYDNYQNQANYQGQTDNYYDDVPQDYQDGYNQVQNRNELLELLPADLHNTPVAQKFKNVSDVVKAMNHLYEMTGKKVESFKEQDWQRWAQIRSTVEGVPSSPDEYRFDPGMLPEHLHPYVNGATEEELGEFFQQAYELGLSNEKAHKAYEFMIGGMHSVIEEMSHTTAKGMAEAMGELSKEWGGEKDTPEAQARIKSKMNNIQAGVYEVAPKLCGITASEFETALLEIRGEKPVSGAAYKAFMKMASGLGSLVYNSSSVGYGNVAPVDAKQNFESMAKDPEITKILLDPRHPQNKEMREKFNRYSRIMHGEE